MQSAFGLFTPILINASVAAQDVPKYLEERSEDYPGCTEIVMRQMLAIPEENRIAMMRYLFEACKTGRSIGKDRTLEMYEIPKTAKPKKKSGFTIQVIPPRSLKDDPFDVDY
ncbi:MAG: hypothetical protein OQK24_05565 [Magnetovibrio sp.]|nr:hypothetical protein [Magnetovibrio sp.]